MRDAYHTRTLYEAVVRKLPGLNVRSGSQTALPVGKPVEHSTPQAWRSLLGISHCECSTIRAGSLVLRESRCTSAGGGGRARGRGALAPGGGSGGPGGPGRWLRFAPGTYFPIEDCVFLQATGISSQSYGGQRSRGGESKSSMGAAAPAAGAAGPRWSHARPERPHPPRRPLRRRPRAPRRRWSGTGLSLVEPVYSTRVGRHWPGVVHTARTPAPRGVHPTLLQ